MLYPAIEQEKIDSHHDDEKTQLAECTDIKRAATELGHEPGGTATRYPDVEHERYQESRRLGGAWVAVVLVLLRIHECDYLAVSVIRGIIISSKEIPPCWNVSV